MWPLVENFGIFFAVFDWNFSSCGL